MGRRKTGVKKVRDIIRYNHTTDLSERQIARALGISRTVVARTLCAFRASGLDYSAVEQMPDSELEKSLETEKAPSDGSRYVELVALFPEMAVELKKKGTTLEWSEEVSMHIEYKAGEAVLVEARESQKEEDWIRAKRRSSSLFRREPQGPHSRQHPDCGGSARPLRAGTEPGL